jgi:hypothetical protein
VHKALAGLAGDALTQEVILKRLEAQFGGGKPRLNAASRRPEFAEALLEAVRSRQGARWVRATKIRHVEPARWANAELQHWTVRHYTSKFQVVLGAANTDGSLQVARVEPPPFSELLSSITLATMSRDGGGGAASTPGTGSTVMMTFTSGAASSGHTTGVDWKHIGNVGDTFYGLFYKGQPATGITPNFIRDAVYYAEWPVSEFGAAWASADWLGTAAESQTPGGKVPEGEARQGQLSDIIADIFPGATRADYSEEGPAGRDRRAEREAKFSAMPNFEVKKHGPIKVATWHGVDVNIATIKKWPFVPATGQFAKVNTDVKSNLSVDTDNWQLLKEARSLGLFKIIPLGREEVYVYGGRQFPKGEQELADALETDGALFERLQADVEAEKAERTRREQAASSQSSSSAPPPPPPGPPPGPPPQTGGGKRLLVGTGEKF